MVSGGKGIFGAALNRSGLYVSELRLALFPERDFDNLKTKDSLGHGDFGDLARFFAQEALADWTGGEDTVLVVVFFTRTHEFKHLLFAHVEIFHAHARSEHGHIGRELRLVHEIGTAEFVLERVDARLK